MLEGCITLQLFSRSNNPSEILCIEVNLDWRWISFSYNAGADFPDLIISRIWYFLTLQLFETWKDTALIQI